MGVKTASDIITEGMLVAGRDDVDVRARVWLQTWLDSQAAAWPWPMLIREAITLAIPAGTTELTIGDGYPLAPNVPIAEKILRIIDNVWLIGANYTARTRLRIMPQQTEPASLYDPATNRGTPQGVRILQPSFGKWTLKFRPVPDKDYTLYLDYVELPAAINFEATPVAAPWYPSDATMIQMIAAECARYDDGPDGPSFQAQAQNVAAMVSNDRIRYGSAPGINNWLQLDQATFGQTNPGKRWWNW